MVSMQNFIIVNLKRRCNRLFLCYNDDGDSMKTEEIVEEVEKNKISIGKIFLCTIFVLLTLIAIFFGATYIRWQAEIGGKHPITYTGQENIKVDKLIDFYGSPIATELKEDEAIYMYCTSEYGKECITSDMGNVLENNFRVPTNVIITILFIDLILLYILNKEGLKGKKRVYVYGSLIILLSLIGIGSQVYKAADYYKLVKDGVQINGEQLHYLRSDNDKKYTPVITYKVDEEQKEYIPNDYLLKGSFEKKEVQLYRDEKKDVVTIKKDYKQYIYPTVIYVLSFVVGVVYLFINKKSKKEDKK